jgi:hypothetical protein
LCPPDKAADVSRWPNAFSCVVRGSSRLLDHSPETSLSVPRRASHRDDRVPVGRIGDRMAIFLAPIVRTAYWHRSGAWLQFLLCILKSTTSDMVGLCAGAIAQRVDLRSTPRNGPRMPTKDCPSTLGGTPLTSAASAAPCNLAGVRYRTAYAHESPAPKRTARSTRPSMWFSAWMVSLCCVKPGRGAM